MLLFMSIDKATVLFVIISTGDDVKEPNVNISLAVLIT